MFRPRLVNIINRRFQDALTTQKHLKVFYKQKIMLNQIKFQLKTNSGVESHYHGPARAAGRAGIPSKLQWSSACPEDYFEIYWAAWPVWLNG